MKTEEVARLWVLEWHPKGGIVFHPILDVLRRNYNASLAGEDLGWLVLGLFKDMEHAQEGGRRVKREIRERRMRDAEVGTGKVTP